MVNSPNSTPTTSHFWKTLNRLTKTTTTSQNDPFLPFKITPQITCGKKQSEAALFAVRVNLPC